MKASTLYGEKEPKAAPAALAPPKRPDPTGQQALFTDTDANKYALMASGFHALERQLEALTITTAESAADCQRGLAEVARALKTCDETRIAQTAPYREKAAAINEAWRPVVTGLEKLKRLAEEKIKGWNEAERRRRLREEQAAREAAAEAARKAEEAQTDAAEIEAQAKLADARNALAVIETAPRGIRTESGTTSSSWVWTYAVVKAEDVPRQYLMLDEKAIRAAIAAGVRQIDGLSIHQDERLRTTTR